jgi:Transposase DDE domain
MDATTVSRPGSQGTDWRIHLSLDLGNLCIDGLEVTDAHGGETLARLPSRPDDIRVADRGYAFVRSLAPDLVAGAGLVVRMNWQNLPLEDEHGERLEVIAQLRRLFANPVSDPQETYVWLTTPQGHYRLRLIAAPLPQEAADRARQRAYQAAKKKGRTPDQRTLFAAGFVLLLTNLPLHAWPAPRIFSLYRIRWQVELLFKRFKQLLNLDGLRAQDPRLAQTYLLGKLLGAILLDELILASTACVPDWFSSLERPVSPWRLTAYWYEQLRSLVRGPISLTQSLDSLPRLQRFLCDSPRKRPQQLAHARVLLANLSVC